MQFNYTYSLKYANGKTYTQNSSKEQMVIETSDEEYRKIVTGVLSGKNISQIEGIPELLAKMRDNVLFADRFKNTDGSSCTKGLKKPRDIEDIEFFMIEHELKALKKMDDPLGIFEHPAEEMKIYRGDGSFITVKAELGKVYIKSSKANAGAMSMDVEDFVDNLSLPMGW